MHYVGVQYSCAMYCTAVEGCTLKYNSTAVQYTTVQQYSTQQYSSTVHYSTEVQCCAVQFSSTLQRCTLYGSAVQYTVQQYSAALFPDADATVSPSARPSAGLAELLSDARPVCRGSVWGKYAGDADRLTYRGCMYGKHAGDADRLTGNVWVVNMHILNDMSCPYSKLWDFVNRMSRCFYVIFFLLLCVITFFIRNKKNI